MSAVESREFGARWGTWRQGEEERDAVSTNRIAEVKTVQLQSDGGPFHALMMALDVNEPAEADHFIPEVAQRFKVQRMASPPDTSALLITIIGELPASSFAQGWQRLRTSDEILNVFMSQMRKADIIRGTRAGQMLESVSLLSE
jgi:hypothetical protein